MSDTTQENPGKQEPEGTHYLVTKEVLQTVFDYMGTRPASEVFEMMHNLRNSAQSVTVKNEAENKETK
jgi:hypothetical protein